MDEVDDLESGQPESVVTVEEKYWFVIGQRCPGAPGTLDGLEQTDGEGAGSANQPLLLAQPSLDQVRQNHTTVTFTETDGPDRKTSVQLELELDDPDQPPRGVRVGGGGSEDGEGCPVCKEPYDSQGHHRMALLNCDHTLCHGCLASILQRAADPSRVRCPLCRQKTPLLHWEIRRMQEEAVFCGTGGPSPLVGDSPPEPENGRAPGLCSALEQRLQARMESAAPCGCCLNRPGLVGRIRRMRAQHRCCYLVLLVLLFMIDLSCLLGVFIPIIVLVLLFSLVSK